MKNKIEQKNLKVSDNLRIIEGQKNILLYNTLFGMPTIVSRDALLLFEAIKNGDISKFNLPSSDLKMLMENYFIINKDADDRKIFGEKVDKKIKEVIEGKKIKVLDLLISEACNFGCKHCILFESIKIGDKERKNSLMDSNTAKLIIDKYAQIVRQNGGKTLNIHFGSAEPLLNWKVLRKCVEYVKNNYKIFKIEFSLNTNLSLLNKEMAIFLRDNKIKINASLDGNKEANDLIRIFKNGKGTFDIILSKIKLLESIGYPLTGISLTITDKNFNLINKEFIYWCKSKHFSDLAFDTDLLKIISIKGEDINSISKKMVELYKESEKLGIESFGTWSSPYNQLMEKSVLDGEIPFFCSAIGGRNIAVSQNLNTTTCSYTTTKIGNIMDLKFGEDSNFGKLIQERIPGKDDICKGCDIEGFCAGQCHSTRELTLLTNNKETFFKMCDYYKKSTKLLLEHELEKNIDN